MLRISKIVDYGILVLTHMAAHPTHVRSAAELAGELGLGQPIVGKVLKLLAQGDLVASTRGARGGYRLSRTADLISVAQIIDALEDPPFGLTECTALPGVCTVEAGCRIRPFLQRIDAVVRRTLESVSVADMIRDDMPAKALPSSWPAASPALRAIPIIPHWSPSK
jgi:FeS assembly SUF system regulator